MLKESKILLYQTPSGQIKVDVLFQDETFWMTQKKMAELFGVQRPAITKHLKNIFESGELVEGSVSSILEHTAAEIIYSSANATKIYMGLTNWKHAPDGKIMKSDVNVAKNYLDEQHIKELNRIVSAYLDLAENRAHRQVTTTMQEWAEFLNQFLELSNYPILIDKGKVSALEAKIKAEQEFEKYRKIQDLHYQSDFDKEIKNLKRK